MTVFHIAYSVGAKTYAKARLPERFSGHNPAGRNPCRCFPEAGSRRRGVFGVAEVDQKLASPIRIGYRFGPGD
jgi:hypothetical protein